MEKRDKEKLEKELKKLKRQKWINLFLIWK